MQIKIKQLEIKVKFVARCPFPNCYAFNAVSFSAILAEGQQEKIGNFFPEFLITFPKTTYVLQINKC